MNPRSVTSLPALSLLAVCALCVSQAALPLSAQAQTRTWPVTSGQRATAQQVAEAGVPLSELAPNAPDQYTVKRGDTLWDISRLFLKSAWRWPELWGMNKTEIRNPHLIYPGQVLYLDKSGGRARLRTSGDAIPSDTVRLSPHVRMQDAQSSALPTLKVHLIEPFLAEPMVVSEDTIKTAPRIVAAEERVMLAKGDRAYARGEGSSHPMSAVSTGTASLPQEWRIFREAVPIKDPATGEVLGYESQYIGKAMLVRPEQRREVTVGDKTTTEIVPATVDITVSKEEIRAGDRMLPEPPGQHRNYVPHAPAADTEALVASVYGSAVRYVAQNQVIAINRGIRDGMEVGHVMALQTMGRQLVDKTDPERVTIRLPDERNGMVMVFRTFERVSYALVLENYQPVKVGDKLLSPRR